MRILWTEPAFWDLTHICDYSGESFGPTRARRTALQIHEAIHTLSQFPHRGRPGRKLGTSELVITGLPFLVVYRVKGDVVEVVRILHGAQRWP